MARRPLVAGNWKMNGLSASVGELRKIIAGAGQLGNVDVMVCPPATLLAGFVAAARGSRVAIGAQDCHTAVAGAYTGDIVAETRAERDAGHARAVVRGQIEGSSPDGTPDFTIAYEPVWAIGTGLTPTP